MRLVVHIPIARETKGDSRTTVIILMLELVLPVCLELFMAYLILPIGKLAPDLKEHLEEVKALHDNDLDDWKIHGK